MSSNWDLIVVGAGSSGAAFATRTAQRGLRVLLLEAGSDFRSAELPDVWRSPNPLPALTDIASSKGYMWLDLQSTRTESQEPALYWRGLGVGGSSTVNGQIAIRPPVEDFQDWVADGCSGWSWDDVLPYFCRLEDDQQFGGEPYHGNAGPIPVYRMPQNEWGSVDSGLAAAAIGAGFAWAPDVNAPGATGVSPYPINSRNALRVSTNDAYLEPARSLELLTVRGDALVDRLLFADKRVVGVQLSDGEQLRADEVVLSAGVIHSPTILMRSGIGPADSLRPLGLTVREDLPVGRNMQDHPLLMINLPLTPEAAASPTDRHTNCCVRYSSGADQHTNDMMLVALNQNALAMERADLRAGAGAIGVWLNQNYSRGSIELKSLDPWEQPTVRENMLSDDRDITRMRQGLRLLADLALRSEIRDICASRPEDANHELWRALSDDGLLDNYILNNAADAQHGTSTCAMGPSGSPHAVVDSECKVLGVPGVRVIDASIFPTVPRANTNLAAIMVGELMAARL